MSLKMFFFFVGFPTHIANVFSFWCMSLFVDNKFLFPSKSLITLITIKFLYTMNLANVTLHITLMLKRLPTCGTLQLGLTTWHFVSKLCEVLSCVKTFISFTPHVLAHGQLPAGFVKVHVARRQLTNVSRSFIQFPTLLTQMRQIVSRMT
jgi:hypothetical protein